MSRYQSAAAMLAAVGLASSVASSQVFNWNNSAGGPWSVATNWTPAGPPNGAGHTAVLGAAGTYGIDTNGSFTVADLVLPNANVTLKINNGTALSMAGAAHANDGLVVVNDAAGGSGTYLRVMSNATLSGSGQWRLNANAGNLATSALWIDGVTLTQAIGHAITGTGRVTGILVNNGQVRADINARTLLLDSTTTSNNGTMTGENGGTLHFAGGAVNQSPSGVIRGTTGSVVMTSTTITGGLVQASAPGTAEFEGGCVLTGVRTGGLVEVRNGSFVVVAGTGHTNDGVWRVNHSAGGSGTFVRYDASAPLLGAGSLVLNANAGNLDTALLWANSGVTMTHAADHSIRGTGRIAGNMINNGTIHADVSARVLRLDSGTTTNSASMMATNGSTLQLIGYNVVNTGPGQLLGNGGTVEVQNSGVTGGAIAGLGGTPVRFTGTSTAADVTLSGATEVPSGSTLLVNAGSGLTNNGTLTINPTADGSGTYMRCDVPTLLAGTGALALNAHAGSLDTALLWANGTTVTNSSGHTLRGTGRLVGHMVNNGTIVADVSGRTLRLDTGTKTNNSLMRATGGATLHLYNGSFAQGSGGQVVADGGAVVVQSASVTGGTLAAESGSTVQFLGGNNVWDLTLSGATEVPSGSTLLVNAGSGLTNNGTLTINPAAGGSGTYMRGDVPTLLAGTGALALNAHAGNLDTAYLWANGATVTNSSGHTLRGTGRLVGHMVNNGTIVADVSGRTLRLDTGTKTNNSLMRATGGATLHLYNGSFAQGSGGQVVADGGAVVVQSASVTGGTLAAESGSTVQFLGVNQVSDLTLSGASEIPSGSTLVITTDTGVNNDGTLTINPTAGGSGTLLRFDANSAVGGNGSIVLNAHPGNFDTAHLTTDIARDVTLGTAQALRGRGRVYGGGTITLRGPVAPSGPGTDLGRLEIHNTTPILTSTSEVHVTVNSDGAGQYDTIAVFGRPMTLAGVVVVDRLPAYVPAHGTTIPIITTNTGNSGTFYRVVNNATGSPGAAWRLAYATGGVNLVATCIADFTADLVLDFNDFLFFLNLYNLGHEDADLNGDGTIDFNDFLEFLNLFNGGC